MTETETAVLTSTTETGSEIKTPKRVTEANSSSDDTSFDNMLSVSFSTPLAGPARAEKIKQMTKNHASSHLYRLMTLVILLANGYLYLQPAFEKSRSVQQILVKVQHSLRRMPGVSSAESGEINSQLQEVGQIISQETSALVDALMNLTLDQEDTDKAVARMSIEANIAKAKIDDQDNKIQNLNDQLDVEKEKRAQAEDGVKNAMQDLHNITEEIKTWKDKAGASEESAAERDGMIQVCVIGFVRIRVVS